MPYQEVYGGIKNLTSSPDIAFQYREDGTPWSSVSAAHNGVPVDYLSIGKIRFVDDGTGVKEYWYKGGTGLGNLVPRYENLDDAQEYLNTMQQLLDEAETARDDAEAAYEQKGNWVNNDPPLTADSSAGQTGDKYQEYDVIGSVTAPFSGVNFASGDTIGPGRLRGTANNQWRFVPDGVANGTVTNAKLGTDVLTKNYPFAATSLVVGPTIKAAIKDMAIFNPDLSVGYMFGGYRKTIGGICAIYIYTVDMVTGARGANVWSFSNSTYTPVNPTNDIIVLTQAGMTIALVVDWTAIPEGANVNVTNEQASRISPVTFKIQDGFHKIIANYLLANPSVIADNSISTQKLSTEILMRNYPWSSTSLSTSITARNAFKDITIYNPDRSIGYMIGGYRKTTGGTCAIYIYAVNLTTNARGANVWSFSNSSYTPVNPTNDIIVLTQAGVTIGLVVDWTAIPEGTNVNITNEQQTRISTTTYRVQGLVDKVIADYLVLNPLTVADAGIANVKLSPDVKIKNFPFDSNVTTPGAGTRAILLDIRLYGVDYSATKGYMLGGYQRIVGGLHRVLIYDTNNGVRGSNIFSFVSNKYEEPAGGIDTLHFSGNSGMAAVVTIDWNAIADGANVNVTSITASFSRLSYSNDPAPSMRICMPPKLHALVGQEYWFTTSAIIRNSNVYDSRPARFAMSASRVSDGLAVTPWDLYGETGILKPVEDVNLTMVVRDQNFGESAFRQALQTIAIATKQKPVGSGVEPSIIPGKTEDVLLIGDSYGEINNDSSGGGKRVVAYIKDFAAADKNVINFKGTRLGSDGIYTEARAGWTESQFANSSASPFVFSGAFNYQAFIDANPSIGNVSTVLFILGMNGGVGVDILAMINQILTVQPTMKFVVCTVPGAEDIANQRRNEVFSTRQLGRLDQNEEYFRRFSGLEATKNVYLCPVHMGFDRVYHLKNSTRSRIQFDDPVNPIAPPLLYNSDHHPNKYGAQSLAYVIYNYLMYI